MFAKIKGVIGDSKSMRKVHINIRSKFFYFRDKDKFLMIFMLEI